MQWFNRANDWPAPPQSYPFLNTAFLQALEDQQDLNADSGWDSHYLHEPEQDLYLPAFIKHHSYGEYVFDWSWADAYARHGLAYYPKLLIAAPFTPATGPRIIGHKRNTDGKKLSNHIIEHCHNESLSGAHILFMPQEEKQLLMDHDWHERVGIQFHWFNRQYQSFDHFLDQFKSRKRKNIKKERQQLSQLGLNYTWLKAHQLDHTHWQSFYFGYQRTYAKRGMQGYISLASFQAMANNPEFSKNMLFMFCYHGETPIASALYFRDNTTLYGRYWGALQDIEGLHFELCYYQGIEYCIENNLQLFNPGTQGEHKISRGFEPILTSSLHHLVQPDFNHAVGEFVAQEKQAILDYQASCYEQLPFNSSTMPDLKQFAEAQ
ncbi:GNAT family N-acetyltransferase [Bermanella sp. R86510]|uniref:GNAT family N-acetyltransferase n=1 Tax=unclassified Bermanella TaxID=2627862 RepID=UPI0037C6CBD8